MSALTTRLTTMAVHTVATTLGPAPSTLHHIFLMCPAGPWKGRYRVCVFITAGPITKLFAGGGGGEWTTCAMIDDEPRPVWMSPLVTH